MFLRGLAALGLLVVPAAIAGGTMSAAPSGGSSPVIPFAFVANRGQASEEVRFVGNGPGFKAQFREGGVTVHQAGATASISFAGGAPHPVIEAVDPTGATANYLRGANSDTWLSGLPLYGTVRYRGVWPGIEIRFRGEAAKAKAEYVVAAGASIDVIRLRFDGKARVAEDGSLLVKSDAGEFREDPPYLYQDGAGGREGVQGSFRIHEDGTVGFTATDWDHSRPLVVDPTILFSGYFGGSAQTNITGMAVNSWYNTVVTGWTLSTELTAQGGVQTAVAGGVDAFIATFGPAGGDLVSCTYLGGSGDDRAFGLAIDSANYIYVTGWTMSKNFPVLNAVQSKLSGARDAFILKLNPTASALVFSTYLGGTGVDSGNAIKLDSANSPIIAGDTTSPNLPSTPGAFQRSLGGAQDAFVAKLNPNGTAITLLTYFGGSAAEHGAAVAIEPNGTFALAGSTFSSNLPVLNAFQVRSGGGQDAYVARLTASGSALIFSTYLGGSAGSVGAPEQANAVEFTSSRSGPLMLMVAGLTASLNFPVTTGVAQGVFAGGLTDGFITNLNGDGSMRKSTFLGGSGDDGINAMALDPYGSGPIVGGYTTSSDFPVKNPVQSASGGGMDGFLVRSALISVTHGTYLGGSGADSVNAIAVDSMFNFYAAGSTGSSDLTVKGQMQAYQGSTLGSFVTKISASFALGAVAAPVFVLDAWHNTGYNGPSSTLTALNYGSAGDLPVAGDWDNTGWKRIGVFRNGLWVLDTNGNGVLDGSDKTVLFGQAGDLPVVGDWNGTGKTALGFYRQGTFTLDLSGHLAGVPTGFTDAVFNFGQAGDLPVAGDWTGSGTSKIGVFRNGQWLLDSSGTHSISTNYSFGQAGDRPVVGNWGGNGDRIGVYRSGVWILDYDRSYSITGNDMVLAFGGSSYTPLVW